MSLRSGETSGAGVRGLGFWVLGLGFRVLGFGFRVLGLRYRMKSAWMCPTLHTKNHYTLNPTPKHLQCFSGLRAEEVVIRPRQTKRREGAGPYRAFLESLGAFCFKGLGL